MANGAAAGRTIVVGVSGGIAAYKACDLTRRLREQGARVRVALTPNAARFVSPLTFQALSGEAPLTDLLDAHQDATFGHLELARTADLVVLAPATADLIARLRAGFADDAVTTTVIAARCRVLLCPAMNTAMWANRQLQENIAALLADPRFRLCGPASGLLADGDVGPGRLAEVSDIVVAALSLLGPRDLAGIKVLVTAGPTREPLDPVRFLSNPSTGKMGYALAAAALRRGASVTLVSGPTQLTPPEGATLKRVGTAQEMLRASLEALPGTQLIIATAAVADFRPKDVAAQKRKKGDAAEVETVTLVRTPDVLAELSKAAGAPRPIFVGFAAETEMLLENARAKLVRKRLDLVVANDVGGPESAFGADESEVTLVAQGVPDQVTGRLPKTQLADRILDRAVALLR